MKFQRFCPLYALFATFAAGPAPAQSGFTDVTSAAGIQLLSGSNGVAVADFNNDGWDDLFVSYTNRKCQLYKNLGNGTFMEMAQSAGVAVNGGIKTAVWGDINNDGYTDLYVASQNPPGFLLLNNGNETFTNITQSAGINQTGTPISVNMADINNDGYLDIYIAQFLAENIMYLNNKNNTFTNYTWGARALDSGKSMGVVFFDYDKDGDADLYLVHDGNEPNFLYQNNGSGYFTEVGHSAGADTRTNGMGVDAGDINNDGYPDLYITNLDQNLLLKNNGNGTFTDISASAGVDDKGMGWGCTFIDYDNDGWLDIYVANDYGYSPYPNVLYRNKGNLTFEQVELGGPVSNRLGSYGTACFDYDQDGNPDLVVANRSSGENVQLFKNAQRPGHWLGVQLFGRASNRSAVGAKLALTDNMGQLHYLERTAGQGWASQNSSVLHVGLGAATAIQSATIYWPSGLHQNVQFSTLNTNYTIAEGDAPVIGLQQSATPTRPDLVAEALTATIFPNPTRDGTATLTLNLPHASILRIQLFDAGGDETLTLNLPEQAPGKCTIPLNWHKSTAGLFTIRVTTLDGVLLRKVLVTH